MEIKFRRVLSVLLVLIISISSFVCNTTFAANDKTTVAEFYDIYDSDMLFQQNKPITLAGTGNKGQKITVKLVDRNNKAKRTASATVAENGSFKVTLEAVKGGYDDYKIIGYENESVFDTLTNIVFGELWLCSGQSNMLYPLKNTEEGKRILENKSGDRYIRAMKQPTLPQNFPFAAPTERPDVPETSWYAGNQSGISSVSAVGYFFAESLRKELNVPVGILSVAIGGSSIFSWLSRTAIDNNEALKNYLTSKNLYIKPDNITSSVISEADARTSMTYGYNQKIAPLKNFSISGTVWYQGEADIDCTVYSEALNTLQASYSKLFGFKDSTMPLICSNLASYHYSKGKLQRVPFFNENLTEVAKSNKYITSVPIYDISLEYNNNCKALAGAIHPSTKYDVGKRLAQSATALVYGADNPASTATVDSVKIKGRYVHITFKDVGNGLKVKSGDNTLYGFTICGESGVYVEARAVIENENTVKVWSENVDEPVSVTYAYSEVTLNCNLFSSDSNGKDLFPVSSFNTSKTDTAKYMQSKDWTTCEILESWHTLGHTFAAYFDTWKLKAPENTNAKLSINTKDKAYGDGSIQLNFNGADNKKSTISVSPAMISDGKLFSDINTNYSNLMSMTFKVKNNTDKSITLDRIRLWTTGNLYYSPSVDGEMKVHQTIPANSDWTEVTVDLSSVFLYGNTSTIPLTNAVLSQVIGIDFVFSHINIGKDNNGEILLDDVMFASMDSAEAKQRSLTHKINAVINHTKTVYSEFNSILNILSNI